MRLYLKTIKLKHQWKNNFFFLKTNFLGLRKMVSLAGAAAS